MIFEEALYEMKRKRPAKVFGTELYCKAYDMSIEALEKQIPKAKHKYKGFRCVCGKEVAKHQIYCEYCGQKLLDWNEVTE